ncbi:hypothetical protein [Jidongwangia harbinensis]|uniref:hypothetical protein n=1 Tax=Jidongwangia harbinensis TaxID=2878561 RepID=UPI001CD9B9FD|nr:hypothetical protein [Jidongwangia harbinensis]MCA2214094.1 hypothetical protein [Jidongwangia harbinensis]
MTAPGNNLLQIALALAFVIASGYASGRIHQWYRHGLERDHAYREGYNHASHSMFTMALQARSTPAAADLAPAEAETGPPLAVGTGSASRTVGVSRRRILAANQRPTPEAVVGRSRHAA